MNERIVAIETSGRHGSVAVAQGPRLLAERPLPHTSRHAVELMPVVRELVSAQDWRPWEIDHLYLSLGPGSFTGLRIAVAVARAMAQAARGKLKVVGVPSLDVIAQNAPAQHAMVIPILDAKRGQVFTARYERQGDGTLVQTLGAALADPAAFMSAALARAGELAAGGGPAQVPITIALLGEGLAYHRAALLGGDSPQVVALDSSLWPGTAASVHRLGYALAQRGAWSDPATLLPLYIRLPEAEEVYRRRHNLPT